MENRSNNHNNKNNNNNKTFVSTTQSGKLSTASPPVITSPRIPQCCEESSTRNLLSPKMGEIFLLRHYYYYYYYYYYYCCCCRLTLPLSLPWNLRKARECFVVDKTACISARLSVRCDPRVCRRMRRGSRPRAPRHCLWRSVRIFVVVLHTLVRSNC